MTTKGRRTPNKAGQELQQTKTEEVSSSFVRKSAMNVNWLINGPLNAQKC